MAISTKHIASIFLNALFAIGVIIAVFGFLGTLQFTAYTILLDEYPLQAYEEDCLNFRPVVSPEGEAADPETTQEQKQECQEIVAKRRTSKQIDDATRSVGLLISGFTLILLFNPRSSFAARFSQ